MRELMTDRRFLLLWLGQAVNTVGHGLTIVALATLLVRSHGAGTLGIVLAVDSAAMGLTLLAGGVVADRYSRTAVMACSDVMRAVAVLGYALAPGDSPVLLLAGFAVLEGTGTALFGPAWRAVLPQIVPAERLREVNAIVQATTRGGMIVGAALGGVLVATVGSRPALLIDAATYAVSLATLLVVRLPSVAEQPASGLRAALHEAREGIQVVVRRPWVTVVMLQGTVQVLFAFAPMRVLTPLVAEQRYGDGAYGLLMACMPAGMLVGSLVALRLSPRHDGRAAMHAVAPTALVMLCLTVHVPLWLFCVAQLIAWAGISVFAVLWFTSLQRAYPLAIQGRVFAVEQLATFALDPIGLALSPVAADAVGVETVGLVAAVVLLATTYAVFLVPGVRDFRDPAPAPDVDLPPVAQTH
ncbi:MAG: MFS transporter [Actinomycetes bacterium]